MCRDILTATPKRMVDSWLYNENNTVKILILKSDLAIHQKLREIFFSQNGFSFETINDLDANEGLGLSLNKVASSIWEKCDGTTTISEIIDSIMLRFNAPRELVCRDVVGFLNQCEKINLLVVNWRPM